MRLSKITLLVLICIIVLSVFVAKISNLITIKYDFESHEEDEHLSKSKTDPITIKPPDPTLVMGDSPDHLMWFVQISDIHISVFHDPNRITEFRDFCNITIEVLKPAVVIASGDLADAKEVDNMGSRQFRQEWIYYSDILRETRITERTLWLDVRGNHDNFNVPSINRQSSFYHEFSIQGKRHKRSYMYTIVKGTEKYSFIGVDACLDPGPRRPLNFIGRILPDQYEMLEQFERDSRGSNQTIWFGHYPTSCIISPEPGLRDLMKNGVAYLCGHLHTLGGAVPNMYTLQHDNFFELELGDWKENRLYRVLAFDHGMFSFTDVTHGTWPVVLVTNPKHALFGLPHKENMQLVMNSSHIRMLVFSPSPMETVRVKINTEDWMECRLVKGPLFVAKWNPQKYTSGLHQLTVYARDQAGRSSEFIQNFALDGNRLHFRLLPRLALMMDATSVFYSVFVTLVMIAVLPLVALRLLHILVREKRASLPEQRSILGSKLVRKLWILCTVNKLFYPLIIYPIYLTVGPWFIGEVIDGHLGAAFAWGTYVDGNVLPGAFSYFYGCVQLFWFHLPFVIVLSHSVDLRFRMICLDGKFCSYSSQVWNNLPCAVLLFFQAVFAYFFYLAYGTMALFLGPLRTWSVIMGLYLWYFSATLEQRDLIEAKLVWGNRECYNAISNIGNSHEM